MVAIGINGYGTIGKRVADAVAYQPDMQVAGVVKATPDHGAARATQRGFSLYVPDSTMAETFERAGHSPVGPLADLITSADIIVDATPSGIGETAVPRYQDAETPFILQGSESADLVDASFCSRTNGSDCIGAGSLRVVSCNTTGLARTITALQQAGPIDAVHATLIRRGGDPTQRDRGPINDIIPTAGSSHHAVDLNTVLPDITIRTNAVTVPTTLMHVHSVTITYADPPQSSAIRAALDAAPRLCVVPHGTGLDSIAALRNWAAEHGRPGGDIWETCVWDASLALNGRQLTFFQAIHQESIVIPETVDAIRTLTGDDPRRSAEITDAVLGVGGLGHIDAQSPAVLSAD